MGLFATAAFLEGSLFWLYLTEPSVCVLRPVTSYYLVTFPHGLGQNSAELYASLFTLVTWFNMLKDFFWTASMVFNVCICADLVLMIKHPFANKNKRILKYHIWVYSIGLLAALEKLVTNYKNSYLSVVQIAAFVAFMLMGLFSSAFAFSRLCKPGVSQEVRQLILKRHVAYILFYFTCNIYLLIQQIQYVFISNGGTASRATWWANVTEILYFSQGILVPSLRLFEPFFFKQAWRNIKNGFYKLITVLLCRKYNKTVYNPTIVGAKFVNQEAAMQYRQSNKAKKLDKYSTEEDFLLGMESKAKSDQLIRASSITSSRSFVSSINEPVE